MQSFLKSMRKSLKELNKGESAKELNQSIIKEIVRFSWYPPVFISTLSPNLLDNVNCCNKIRTKEVNEFENIKEFGDDFLEQFGLSQIPFTDSEEFKLTKHIKANSDKAIVIIGNTEDSISYNRSILIRKLTKQDGSMHSAGIIETSIKLLDSLSRTWDEATDTIIRNSIHKITFSKENGLRIDSRLIGYTEIDKNILFQSISEPDEIESLFKKLSLTSEYSLFAETINSILLLNKFDFIEGGINDKYKVKSGISLTKFWKLNDMKENEFVREFWFWSSTEAKKIIKLISFYIYEGLYAYIVNSINKMIRIKLVNLEIKHQVAIVSPPCQSLLNQSNSLLSLMINISVESIHFYSWNSYYSLLERLRSQNLSFQKSSNFPISK